MPRHTLYITKTSPYARIVRILLLEKALDVDIVVAKTRVADSPYYAINVSGRVPYLVRDDGFELESSYEICAYLDRLAPPPTFIDPAPDAPITEASWPVRQLYARAESFVDGVSVWVRELRRPSNDQSLTVIRHEHQRARRLADWWEAHVDHEKMTGRLNHTQAILFCALDLEHRIAEFDWRSDRPRLTAFAERVGALQSVWETRPNS